MAVDENGGDPVEIAGHPAGPADPADPGVPEGAGDRPDGSDTETTDDGTPTYTAGQETAGCLITLLLLVLLGSCFNAVFLAEDRSSEDDWCDARKEAVNNMPDVPGTAEDDVEYLAELHDVLEDCNPEFFE